MQPSKKPSQKYRKKKPKKNNKERQYLANMANKKYSATPKPIERELDIEINWAKKFKILS